MSVLLVSLLVPLSGCHEKSDKHQARRGQNLSRSPHQCSVIAPPATPPVRIDGLRRVGESKILITAPPGHAGEIHSIEVSPDGRLVATGGQDQRLLLWDIQSKRVFKELGPHEDGVTALSFSPDGRYLASGTGWREGGRVRVFSMETGRLLVSKKGDGWHVSRLSFLDNGILAVEWTPGQPTKWRWRAQLPQIASDSAASPDKSIRVTGSPIPPGHQKLKARTDERIRFLVNDSRGSVIWAHKPAERVSAIAFNSVDGTLVLGDESGRITVYDIRLDKTIRVIDVRTPIRSLAVARDASRAVSVLSDAQVVVHDLTNGVALPPPTVRGKVRSAALCPDGALVAIVRGGPSISVFEVDTRRLDRVFETEGYTNVRVAFSPTGETLAVTGLLRNAKNYLEAGVVHVIDRSGARVIRSVGLSMVLADELAFLPNRKIAVGGAMMSSGIEIIDQGPAVPNRIVGDAEYMEAMSVSRDGGLLAEDDGSHGIVIRDTRTWKTVRAVTSPLGGTAGLAFSPCGGYLAVLGRDGSVRLHRVR